jgi:hypothetical protein
MMAGIAILNKITASGFSVDAGFWLVDGALLSLTRESYRSVEVEREGVGLTAVDAGLTKGLGRGYTWSSFYPKFESGGYLGGHQESQ